MPLSTDARAHTLDGAIGERPLRFGQLFGRIALAGVAAGLAAGVFSLLVTERVVSRALELEKTRAAAGGAHGHGNELFDRGQQLVGGFLGTVFAGVVLAIMFAVVYAVVRHRLPGRTDVGRTAVLTAMGFSIFALLPALVIPANPPAVGDPGTVGARTATYGAVLLLGVISAMLVSALVSALRSHGAGLAGTAIGAVVATVALVTLSLLVVPGNPDPMAADVPASLVWDFRLASIGQLAVLWGTLGLTAGRLLDRVERSSTAHPAARATPA